MVLTIFRNTKNRAAEIEAGTASGAEAGAGVGLDTALDMDVASGNDHLAGAPTSDKSVEVVNEKQGGQQGW